MNYVFGWQEKTSLLTIDANQSAQIKGISDIFHVQFQDCFAFSTENQAYFYFSKKDTENWKLEGGKYLTIGYIEQLLDRTQRLLDKFHIVIEDMQSLMLKEMDNDALHKQFLRYFEIVSDIAGIYHASQPEGLFEVDKKIKELLQNTYQEPELEAIFITLSSPHELDLTQKEKIDWLELVEKRSVYDKEYLNHAKKYAAYFFNTYSYDASIAFLKNRKEQTRIDELKDEIKDLLDYQKQTKQKWIRLSADVSPQVLQLSRVLQKISIDRFALKEGWQGAEFLALNFFIEIANRIGINIEDFFASYGKNDIEAFLVKGKHLNTKEIENRKKALFINLKDQRKTFLSGSMATDKIQMFFGKKSLQKNTVKGMAVQRGVVTGRVRVILVEDVTAFAKVAKNFNKGEVLVTTMTSPNIISLVKSASAIVTNEGGICSHAAIVSRELGIPCVVGTENATRVFKTGDYVLVDAVNGEVKKIDK